jgi:glycerate 2-kinase
MRVLVAFDKFKDAISAAEACSIAVRALRGARPAWTVETCPLSDGGDGFEAVLQSALGGESIGATVAGPRGELHEAGFSIFPSERLPAAARLRLQQAAGVLPTGRMAIIEMARASGLQLLSPEARNPWDTHSYGTGQLIRAAAEIGARCIILGIGGSATNDLGLGALSALGLEFRTADRKKIRPPTPRTWSGIAEIEGEVFASIPPIVLASDVTNPLLGAKGATYTFAGQKGLPASDFPDLENAMRRMAEMLCALSRRPVNVIDEPGAGAAGGIGFGLRCAARASFVPGYAFVAECLDLAQKIAAADLVITGEGRFDATSYGGKGPGEVATAALAQGKPVHVFAGQVSHAEPLPRNLHVHALSAPGPVSAEQLRATRIQLGQLIQRTFAD